MTVQAQKATHVDLTGKWQKNHTDKGAEDISTLDLTESGPVVTGTATSSKGKALTISDGYYVGDDIQITATRRQGPLSWVIVISGHSQGDKMILNVKKGNGGTYPAIAERVPAGPRR